MKISGLVNGKQGITPEMAIKLAAGLGATPELLLRARDNDDSFQPHRLPGY